MPMVWSASDNVWRYSTKLDKNGTIIFDVTGVEDKQFKLTQLNDITGHQSITWEKASSETSVVIPSVVAVLSVVIVGIIYYYRKRI
jgi:hypothetical protein